MDGHAGDVDAGSGSVEVLVLNAPLQVPVHGVGVPGPESLHVEVVRPLADLLVRGEGHTDPAVGQVLPDERLAQGHDLRNARLIVRPQEGGAVGGDEGAALHPLQHREVSGPDNPAVPGQNQIPAVVAGVENGVHVLPGEGGGGVQVGDEPQGRGPLAAGGGRQNAGHDAEGADLDLLEAQILHLPLQLPGQLQLTGGAGGFAGAVGGLGVHLDIPKQSLICAHRGSPP